ncbi:MAG: hypothetical protein R3C32_01395 [Chloroflexota bacterium]
MPGYDRRREADAAADAIRSLLDDPSPRCSLLRREDGAARVARLVPGRRGRDEIVVAITDRKLEHLRRDPRCTVMVFEAVPPFRGVQAAGVATLSRTRVRHQAGDRVALPGARARSRYADIERRPPGVVVRLPLADARAWDLADKLPDRVHGPTTGKERETRARRALPAASSRDSAPATLVPQVGHEPSSAGGGAVAGRRRRAGRGICPARRLEMGRGRPCTSSCLRAVTPGSG